ncbi:transposable element Tcb1 transposase [Trichonephila clavipes]|nr:transposable element Tcb1 transposase [Trichonephila clavipes]
MASKSKELDVNVKNMIIQLRNEGLTYRAIGIQLNINLFTVRSVVKKFNETGSTEKKVRSGWPGIFSAREKRSIIKEVKKNSKISAPQLAKDVASTSLETFSVQTIRNVLHEESYYGREARKKPFISERNRRKRLDFVKSHVNLSDEFWNAVIFSNESKFNIFGSDGLQYVWRKPNTELEKQYLTSTVKHGGGSVLVWGCMAANEVGKLCFIVGIMTAHTYIDILCHNLQSSAQKRGLGTSFVFQQDNDPKHTANLTREWLLHNSLRQLKTPPQSPDINPIENLWHKLDVEVRKHKISSKDELKRILLQEWHKIPNSTECFFSSDEAHFWLNGYVNKQNCRIWSEANPQVYVETPLHPEKLTVWCALWAGGIIGPYFFKNDEGHNVTVNGDRYRAMITNFFIPELNNHDVQELWFQQDGATCHIARATIDLLKDTFGDRLISRSGPVNWPPRSCDLTPLDYFLWGYVKSLVYADKPQTLDHLEDNIRRVIADIRPQMLEKVIENWTSRLDYIRASRGSPMPEIIFKM